MPKSNPYNAIREALEDCLTDVSMQAALDISAATTEILESGASFLPAKRSIDIALSAIRDANALLHAAISEVANAEALNHENL